MLRKLGASVSILALLVGFAAAPHRHLHPTAHEAGHDGRATHVAAILHAHVAPHDNSHAHDAPGREGETTRREILPADGFLFQAAAWPHLESPAASVEHVAHRLAASVWCLRDVPQPRLHGPPRARPPASRAPPPSAPAIA